MFGFRGGEVPLDPEGVSTAVSLKDRAADLAGFRFDINVICVGFDTLDEEGDAFDKLDYAIYRTHEIFRSATISIGRIKRYRIDQPKAGGFVEIDSEAEAAKLYEKFGKDNSGIDVFIVCKIWDGFFGISPIKGSCISGHPEDGLLGGDIGREAIGFARTFAHEIGHFLGLPHKQTVPACPSPKNLNLMAQTGCVSDIRNSVELDGDETGTMLEHCSIQV